jgi:hypothetical protein
MTAYKVTAVFIFSDVNVTLCAYFYRWSVKTRDRPHHNSGCESKASGVRYRVKSCRICGGKVALVQVFSAYFGFPF